MKRHLTACLVAAGLTLAACGSQPTAAPAPVTKTVTKTTTNLATMTQAVTVAETTTEVTTATTTEILDQPVTVSPEAMTVVKTVDRPVTKIQTATETATVTAEATVTAAAPSPAAASGSVPNGSYLVGVDIKPGNYKCAGGDPASVFWRISDHSGKTIDNGFGLIAFITADAYTTDLNRCDGLWSPVS